MLSNHFPWYFFGLPLPLLTSSTTNHSHLLTITSTFLLFTCPNHLNLTSLILSSRETTPTLSPIFSFQVLSLLIFPHICLISATSIFWTWKFLIGQHYAAYNIVGLATTCKAKDRCYINPNTMGLPSVAVNFIHAVLESNYKCQNDNNFSLNFNK